LIFASSFAGLVSTIQILPQSVLSPDGLHSVHSRDSNRLSDHLLGTTRAFSHSLVSIDELASSLFQGFVLTITLIREALDDFVRFLRDRELNGELYEKLTRDGLVPVASAYGRLSLPSHDSRVHRHA
jgi:hypothetical protein